MSGKVEYVIGSSIIVEMITICENSKTDNSVDFS